MEINPIVTNQQIRATVRKKKTDKTDAELISQSIRDGNGHMMTEKSLGNSLKKLIRGRKYLVNMRSNIKKKLKSYDKDVCDVKSLQKTFKQTKNHLDNQIERIEEQIDSYNDEDIDILKSIPGVGNVIATGIRAEIGDIDKFKCRKALTAFAGLDPKLNQSGTVNSTGRLTKRGASALRYFLFMAAHCNICSNSVFTKYYQKHRDNGRSYKQAVCATSRKILEIIFVLLSRRKPFDDQFGQSKT